MNQELTPLSSTPSFLRSLSLFDSIMIMIGIVIGSGIFLTTGIMAKDGLFFKKAARIHPRFRTPGFSILIQAVLASILTVSGRFEQLFTFAMFVAIMFWIAAAFSVFTLRKKFPDLPRPYKTWGYPVIPSLFIAASLGILLNTLLNKPVQSLAGLGFTALGIPVYYYWKKRSSL